MENKSGNKKLIIGLIALVVVIGAFAIIYNVFRAKPTEGSKSITINVVNSREETTSYSVKTDAEYLRQAMEEAEGLINGEYGNYGIDKQPVNDGDEYSIVYTPAE